VCDGWWQRWAVRGDWGWPGVEAGLLGEGGDGGLVGPRRLAQAGVGGRIGVGELGEAGDEEPLGQVGEE
jgi:hypothetical protein